MAKEIHEQPEVVARTLAHYLDMSAGRVALPFELPDSVAKIDKLTIIACGTAYIAGLTAKYWFERFARLPVTIDVASEFRYGEAPMTPGGLTVVVSQSGETADTLASLRYARANSQTILSVVNVTDLDDGARERRHCADAGRPGDRRRLDEGLHPASSRFSPASRWRSAGCGER